MYGFYRKIIKIAIILNFWRDHLKKIAILGNL